MLLAGVLAGCAAPSPPPLLIALPSAAPTAAAAQPSAMPVRAPVAKRLLVRRVAIPEYLLARRVRYRADASTVAEWPHTFWAERIEVAVTREFVAALRQSLPGWMVCEGSCPEQPASLSLRVELAPLDYLRALRRLQARARVTLFATEAPAQTLQTIELGFELPTAADTPQAQAQAVTELLHLLAQVLLPVLQNVPETPAS